MLHIFYVECPNLTRTIVRTSIVRTNCSRWTLKSMLSMIVYDLRDVWLNDKTIVKKEINKVADSHVYSLHLTYWFFAWVSSFYSEVTIILKAQNSLLFYSKWNFEWPQTMSDPKFTPHISTKYTECLGLTELLEIFLLYLLGSKPFQCG